MNYAESTADRYRIMAYWYAVGHSDGAGTVDHAEPFSVVAAKLAREYANGERFTLSSVPTMYAEWLNEMAGV